MLQSSYSNILCRKCRGKSQARFNKLSLIPAVNRLAFPLQLQRSDSFPAVFGCHKPPVVRKEARSTPAASAQLQRAQGCTELQSQHVRPSTKHLGWASLPCTGTATKSPRRAEGLCNASSCACASTYGMCQRTAQQPAESKHHAVQPSATSRKPKRGQSYFSKPPRTEVSELYSPCQAQQRKGAPKWVIVMRWWCFCSQNFCFASPPREPKRHQLAPNCGHSKHIPAGQQSSATAPPACASHLAARRALLSEPCLILGSDNSSIPQSKKIWICGEKFGQVY